MSKSAPVRVYTYARCSTCRNATAWLRDHGISFEEIPIRETPPSTAELTTMLGYYDGDIRRLFNTSGMDYREQGLAKKLPALNQQEAFALLRANGNLVKRPFLLGPDFGLVGFKPDQWAEKLA